MNTREPYTARGDAQISHNIAPRRDGALQSSSSSGGSATTCHLISSAFPAIMVLVHNECERPMHMRCRLRCFSKCPYKWMVCELIPGFLRLFLLLLRKLICQWRCIVCAHRISNLSMGSSILPILMVAFVILTEVRRSPEGKL